MGIYKSHYKIPQTVLGGCERFVIGYLVEESKMEKYTDQGGLG